MGPWLAGLLETGPVEGPILAVRDGVVNLFVIRGRDGLVCIDAGWRARSVERGFRELGLDSRDVLAVCLTHWHWDHARCACHYPNATLYAAPNGKKISRPRVDVKDGDAFKLAGVALRAIATPGHTADSMCYLVEGKYLFTGDALMLHKGTVVSFGPRYTHDMDAAKQSIRKLARLKKIECLLTAHSGLTREIAPAFRHWTGQ